MVEEHERTLAIYRFEKAKDHLLSARVLLDSGKYADSIGRSYYAVFTAIRALLALLGKDRKRHSGVIALFNECFIKKGLLPVECYKILIAAKDSREAADYADYVSFGSEEAESQFVKAKGLVSKVEEYLEAVEVLKRK
ncbi:MAG: HEPN domain-containing protein [Deltaproteobacteria bacterium]|nr:HEPN domain-containing protein [Deltaproteobacteria bacterium]